MAKQEKYLIDQDIHVLCIEASSFPAGVGGAHQKLHKVLSSSTKSESIASAKRLFYGISRPDKQNKIIYKAAANELYEGEGKKLGLETFVIKKGEYISILLKDWRSDERMVEKTFKELLSNSDIDQNGYCLEIYLNERDMRCLVPLKPSVNKVQRQKFIPLFI